MNPSETNLHTDLKPFAERVEEQAVGPCRLLILEAPVPEVVSFRGSFCTYPDFAAGEDLVQEMVVSLLDKGTRRRDRFAIAEALDNRGAQLRFYADALRIGFSGRALREDVPEVLEILAEQLREPLFDPAEFEKARAHVAAGLQRSMESTGTQASAALARRLYGRAHPNYVPEPQEELARLEGLTVEAVHAFHERHFGANDLLLVLVGDVDGRAAEAVLHGRLGDWAPHPSPPRYEAEAATQQPGQSVVSMPDKRNIDVRMGHALPVRRQDPEYLPLYLANFVLGGNFSARLMTVIRDEMGLTYGIHSSFSGVTTQYSGHWQVSVTLSQENVERGIAATRAEVERFVEGGITGDELQEKKTTVTGSFKVGLATTAGLASALHHNAERGFDVGYLDRFPEEVEALTLDGVNEAVRGHFQPARFHLGLAGMVEAPAPADGRP